ncbi:MAG: hypothetical protein QNJ65_19125 [Xenococcaceae cyanobacterium MO_234.B1]|nr:hypothetical protein [Xenococcaceae cyanobacterium MO_234.B1]
MDCSPKVVVINRPQPITTVLPSFSTPKVVIAQQILRGQRGATDIVAIAPLELNSNDELRLRSFTFTQTTNLATWLINHNLNKPCPFVTIKDDFGEIIIGDILTIDNNNLQIRFNQPTTGTAYLI